MPTILGIKGNMTNRYSSRGLRVPVTIVQADPNVVVEIKDKKVLLGLGSKKKVKKPQSAIVTKIGLMPRYLKEIKKESAAGGEIKVGDKITVGAFALGDAVKVTGTTKGHGFAGGVKRWGFHGGPKTHGQSDRHRAPGSIGQGTTPGRVYKGKHMAGHYGNAQITTTGLEVIDVDTTNNLLLIKGAIPGAKNGFLIVEKTGKVKKYVAPPEEKPKEDEEESSSSTKVSEDKKDTKEEKSEGKKAAEGEPRSQSEREDKGVEDAK